jgi:hypothetical protein
MTETCCGSNSEGACLVPSADPQKTIEEVPGAGTRLSWRERLEMFKFRWGIRRMRYSVAPGLYRIGNPYRTIASDIEALRGSGWADSPDTHEY